MNATGWWDRVRGARTRTHHRRIAEWVDAIEPDIRALSDAELRALTGEFRERLGDGEDLEDLLVEAFAAVREAARRVLGERPLDEQVMGGVVLHRGDLADMKTGEGKTLTATMPAYLNALTGDGVHVVTSHEHLARRDAEWMEPVYRFLGLTAALITPDMPLDQRRTAYAADITYGTYQQLGYDYLRDNRAWEPDERVQRGHGFAVVDEADQVFIDEARSPMSLTGPAEHDESTTPEQLRRFAALMEGLDRGVHYEIDRRGTVAVTDAGLEQAEELLGTDDLHTSPLWHVLNNAIKAKELYRRDVDYVVLDGEASAVDAVTGRVQYGRRFGEGLHEAIEAKEGLEITERPQVLATITVQNYFRLYDKLAGMTGTAGPDAAEYREVYLLDVVEIPTSRPVRRIDHPSSFFSTGQAMFAALAERVAECHAAGRPVFVATHGVEESEQISRLLDERHVPHELLTADDYEREAAVIAQAGRLGGVTVAAGMLGRGTDIKLGGTDGESTGERAAVLERGGLSVLGASYYPYRRLNDHLRGRAGRRGDPGESQFYISVQAFRGRHSDDFIDALADSMKDGVVGGRGLNAMADGSVRHAEERARERRARVRGYDDVTDEHRSQVYAQRRDVLEGTDLRERVREMITDVAGSYVAGATARSLPTRDELEILVRAFAGLYPVSFDVDDLVGAEGRIPPMSAIAQRFAADIQAAYDRRERGLGSEVMRQVEQRVLITVIDLKWPEHLTDLDVLQDELAVRALGGRDPLAEYRRKSEELFEDMSSGVKEETVRYLFNVEVELVDE